MKRIDQGHRQDQRKRNDLPSRSVLRAEEKRTQEIITRSKNFKEELMIRIYAENVCQTFQRY